MHPVVYVTYTVDQKESGGCCLSSLLHFKQRFEFEDKPFPRGHGQFEPIDVVESVCQGEMDLDGRETQVAVTDAGSDKVVEKILGSTFEGLALVLTQSERMDEFD
jgi:hypothetical protein